MYICRDNFDKYGRRVGRFDLIHESITFRFYEPHCS